MHFSVTRPDGAVVDHITAQMAIEMGLEDSAIRTGLQQCGLRLIAEKHATLMHHLTGDATIEERDTWKTKEEAARAVIAGSATDGQAAMIGLEAQGAEMEPSALAQVILGKAEAFQALIGMAAGLKAKAKISVAQATDDTVPIEQAAASLETVIAQISDEVDAVAAQWQVEEA